MFISISDSETINVENIESISRGGKLNTKIIMTTGDKFFAEMPYELFLKRIKTEGDSMRSLIKNISDNTQSMRV